jgi:hypothetical protein
MANSKSSIKTELYAEINSDLSKFAKDFTEELRATTPIKTGQARSGWVNTFKQGSMGRGASVPLARNQVPYIGVLDSNKTSRQAPMGIVEPALKKATRKNR